MRSMPSDPWIRSLAGGWRPRAALRRFAYHAGWLGGLVVLLGTAAAPRLEAGSGFATAVVSYVPGPGVAAGFDDPARILGGPRGLGETMGSTDVLTLGERGQVTVTFDGTLFDGPGVDLIVFENSLFFGNGLFGELAYVEVSSDGTHWARFPSTSDIPGPLGAFGTYDPALVSGLAGNAPVFANVDTNTLDPFDAAVAGGDAFDLADLTAVPEVVAGNVDLQAVQFVRLVDVRGDGSDVDSRGLPIYDPWDPSGAFVSSADFDAVAAVHLAGTVAVETRAWGSVKALYRGSRGSEGASSGSGGF